MQNIQYYMFQRANSPLFSMSSTIRPLARLVLAFMSAVVKFNFDGTVQLDSYYPSVNLDYIRIVHCFASHVKDA